MKTSASKATASHGMHMAIAPPPEARGRRKLARMNIAPGANGGFIAEHQHDTAGMAYRGPSQYPLASGPEMVHHVMKHFGVGKAAMMSHLDSVNDEKGKGE